LIKGELDVVHVHNLPDFLVFSALLPRLLGRKVILDVHDSVPETFATKFSLAPIFWKALCLEERLSARVAHKIICVNRPQCDTLVARGIPKSKMFISMNVPDPRIFPRPLTPATAATKDPHFNLVYHGTMSERLGVDLVIRAVAHLRDRMPTLRLHLWGGGDDLATFQRLVHELGLDDTVLFRPQGFPLKELPHCLGGMQVGVVGNRRNAAGELMLPVKLLEYVALGIPVIVPRLRTIQQYFTEDRVLYYDPGDVESLARAVEHLYCQPHLGVAMAERARDFLTEHGWDQTGPEFVAMYRELVKRSEI
jgi:glycosyltransferase involved in cell wall biosynthesis